jgi:hypothetical protein
MKGGRARLPQLHGGRLAGARRDLLDYRAIRDVAGQRPRAEHDGTER